MKRKKGQTVPLLNLILWNRLKRVRMANHHLYYQSYSLISEQATINCVDVNSIATPQTVDAPP